MKLQREAEVKRGQKKKQRNIIYAPSERRGGGSERKLTNKLKVSQEGRGREKKNTQ